MKKMNLIAAMSMVALVLVTGCGKKPKAPGYVPGTFFDDSPLPELNYDAFKEPTGPDAYIFKNVHFDYDQYSVRWEDRETLNNIADWMKRNTSKRLLVEGHCDERGSNEYNLALGEQRALATRQYLVDQGVNPFRIQTISYGEERPLDPGHDEGAWRRNRRSQFLIAD